MKKRRHVTSFGFVKSKDLRPGDLVEVSGIFCVVTFINILEESWEGRAYSRVLALRTEADSRLRLDSFLYDSEHYWTLANGATDKDEKNILEVTS